MKKTALTVVVLLAFITVTSFADEQETKATDKPLIFIDTNSWMGFLIAVNTGFATFASLARELGYEVDHGRHTEINRDLLKGVSVYILSAPMYFLLERDKLALREFIQEGGSVILLEWDYPSTGLNSFIESYDVEFLSYNNADIQASVPASSPLSGPYKCNTLRSRGRRVMQIHDNSNVITAARYSDGTPALVIPTHKHLKKGKLIISGDLRMFANSSVNGDIELADNMAFVKNLLVYLKGNYDLGVVLSKYKGKNLTSGDTITAICKIKNFGENTSDETKVSFYLTDDGSLDTSPAVALATLKTLKFPALDPGKRKKLSVKVKLPNWLSPGSYKLVVQVDPDGTSSDTDTSNNVKVGKKDLLIN